MKQNKRIVALLVIGFGLSQSVSANDLMEVYRIAETSDTEINKAQAAFLASEQTRLQSRAQLLPQADFSAEADSSDQEIGDESSSASSWGYSLTLTQALYNRKNYDLLDKTSKLQAKAEVELNLAKQSLILRVAEAYFNVLAAQDNLEFAKSEIEAYARQLEQTKQRFEVGLIAITDVHEAQAAHDLSIAREIVARNDLTSSVEALRELTGAYIEDYKQLIGEIPLLHPNPENPDLWAGDALKNNLQIIAEQLALEASREDIKQQQAGHLPTLDLVGSYNYDDDAGARFNGESLTDTSIMLQLKLPLYRGGETTAQIKESEQLYNRQLAVLEQARRSVQRSSRDAYSSVIASISQVNALQQGIVSTQSSLAATEAGLEVGTRTTVDVLNTRKELFKVQRDHARARYDYLLSTLRLKDASGSLSEDDLAKINKLLE